jgi:hypothetical protein
LLRSFASFFFGFFLLYAGEGFGQELEPRSINNLPVGTNFFLGGYGYSQGNILLDAALPIEDLDSRIHTGMVAYVRSIKFFGLSSKMNIVLPFVSGSYDATVEGADEQAYRSGIGDLRVRFSFNFIGSQAMDLERFKNYNPEFVSGVSVQVIVPTGDYDSDFLINAGSNRWVVKPQWGMAKNLEKWSLEAYLAIWVFGENTDFFGGNKFTQDPLYTIKGHAIRSLRNNNWMALSVGYGIGGVTYLNGEQRDTRISTMRLGFVYSFPVSVRSSLKLGALSSIRFERGSDFNGITLAYQYRWLKKKSKIN